MTVLVSHNVICFRYFMPMSHGVNKKAPTIVSLHPSPLLGFHQCLFVVLQAVLYQPSFALIRLLQKKCIFKIKQIFSFNFLLVGFDFAVLRICSF